MEIRIHMQTLKRTVLNEDAVAWLEKDQNLTSSSLVASLPDYSEFPQLSLKEWKEWFVKTSKLIFSQCSSEGVVIFYQSDIKHEGTWVDKGFLCQKAAELSGFELLWHKILCRAPAGTVTFGRPSYSHILCFSQGVRADISKSTPDVLPDLGDKVWERGMGLQGCLMIAKFISEHTSTKTIVNPFCGHGSMLAMGNAFGLDALGIERSPKRAEKAKHLAVSNDFKKWLEN